MITAGLAGLAGLALAVAPLAAQASTSARPSSTPACVAAYINCATPVVAVSATSSTDLTPSADFALRYAGPVPGTGQAYGDVKIDFSNSLQDGTEDWTWNQIATVPVHGRGAFKFTGFDNTNFKNDPVYELEYTPNGTDTGLCLTISSRYRSNGAVLGTCVSAAQQSFIVTPNAPFLETAPFTTPAPAAQYNYVFDVSQNLSDAQHHLALLAPHPGDNGELVAAGTPVHAAAGKASLDEWIN
jgi:hypothetical protein